MKARGNSVQKAVMWSDRGAEFVFDDGVVLSFLNDMDTFTAVSISDPQLHDMMITNIALSQYREKVTAALHIYNSFEVHPKLVDGFTKEQPQLWRSSSPIDTIVLCRSRELFSKSSSGATATLSCALQRVKLTLYPTKRTFSVSWPGTVVAPDGTKNIFVSPINEKGEITNRLPTTRAVKYVTVTQVYSVSSPPVVWRPMLELAMDMDNGRFIEDEGKTEPLTLPQTNLTNGKTMRFSSITHDEAHALVGSGQMQELVCSERLHSGAVVAWRYDSGNANGMPAAMYRALSCDPRDSHCAFVEALVKEDMSVVAAEPNGSTGVMITHHLADGNPPHIYDGTDTSLLPKFVVSADSLSTSDTPVTGRALGLGRYLPDVGHTVVVISRRNALCWRRLQYPNSSTATAAIADNDGAIVKRVSRVDGVGCFTALTNGIVRGAFDDRTVIALLPDETGAEMSLVASVLSPEATSSHIRVAAVTPEHPIFRHLQFLIPFRRFAYLSDDDQRQLIADTEKLEQSIPNVQMVLRRQEQEMAEMDVVMYKTSKLLAETEALSLRMKEALCQDVSSS